MIEKAVIWTLVFALTGFIGGGLMFFSWNMVMPSVFGLPSITFWNGFWLFWLAQAWTGGVFGLISAYMKYKI